MNHCYYYVAFCWHGGNDLAASAEQRCIQGVCMVVRDVSRVLVACTMLNVFGRRRNREERERRQMRKERRREGEGRIKQSMSEKG